jgi:SPP1 family predicted phage head-tail adaptor
MMNIGRLNKRVTLYKFGEVTDSMGQETQQLISVATIWGDLRPVRGNEYYEVQKIRSKVSHKLYIRYNAAYEDIDSNWYVGFEDKRFDVVSVINVDLADKMFEIYCNERVNHEDHYIAEPDDDDTGESTEEPSEDPETEPTEDPEEGDDNE